MSPLGVSADPSPWLEKELTPIPLAFRQATAAYTGTAGQYLEGLGAADRMLCPRTRQYGQRNG